MLTPIGLALLAAYSAGIERAQLELARIDRACDVTDFVDNVTGAAIGVVIGLLLIVVFRPWRANHPQRPARTVLIYPHYRQVPPPPTAQRQPQLPSCHSPPLPA